MTTVDLSASDDARHAPVDFFAFVVSETGNGRLRCSVSGLRDNPAFKRALASRLNATGFFTSIDASTVTGTVLLRVRKGIANQGIRQRVVQEAASAWLDAMGFIPVPRSHTARRRRGSRSPQRKRPRHTQSQQRDWHCMSPDEVVATFASDTVGGLPATVVQQRRQQFGMNRLDSIDGTSDLMLFLNQFRSWPVAMLGVSAAVAVLSGGILDALVIGSVVMLNAGIGFATERFADRTIASLTRFTPEHVLVRRGGKLAEIAADELVPGDVVLLRPGSYVPADIRLIESQRLTVDESLLTGESEPVGKSHRWVGTDAAPLAERANMLYSGTTVTGGGALGLAVATGPATETGRIQAMVGAARPPATPMQRQLDTLGTRLALGSAVLCVVAFFAGAARGYGVSQMLKTAISLGVAAVPEGLPAVATSSLALGIRDMRRRKVLIRRLDAVETLGSVSVMCFDKTGTLTLNEMRVVRLYGAGREIAVHSEGFFEADSDDAVAIGDDPLFIRLLTVAALCNEADVAGTAEEPIYRGSATETALLDAAHRAQLDITALRARYTLLHTQYRAEGRPYMITVHGNEGPKMLVALKGRPKDVLAMSSHYRVGKDVYEIGDAFRASVIAANARMAEDALRVLGIAYRYVDNDVMHPPKEHYIWLGLAGMADPVRDGIRQLIASFHDAGIATKMITGDQATTAHAIGTQLRLSWGGTLNVIKASELHEPSHGPMAHRIDRAHVFARVTPAEKLKIVKNLQAAGRVVAMTGDGINDGPALKAANVGIAMGDGGSGMARSVSDVVLEDDNLSTMITAVKEGRMLYANIRKSLHFLLATNFSEVLFMLAALATGLGRPLNPMQLLWINLATDVFPGLALSFERPEPDVLRRPPREPGDAIIGARELKRIAAESVAITAGTLGSYSYTLWKGGTAASAGTCAFTTLTMAQLLHAYHCRSDRATMFTRDGLSARNRVLDVAIGTSLAAQALTLLVPGLRRVLGTVPLAGSELAVTIGGAVLPLVVNEATKFLAQRPSAAPSDAG